MKKILVVEDEPVLSRALVDTLRREKFEVIEEPNGESGLARALKEPPDLILLDIILPVMDGISMLKKMREDEWGRTASVIILTNLSDEARIQDSIASGVNDYLVKANWAVEDLVDKVIEKIGNA
jgi:DNA-binding response OmpR family regulator